MSRIYRTLLHMVTIIYLAGVIYNTLLNRNLQSTMHYELQLFWSYQLVLNQNNIYFWQEIVLNILLFLPAGILLPLCFPSLHRLSRFALIAFGSSLCIELVQLVGKIGLFEFDDIFNNVLGALIGFSLYRAATAVYHHGDGWVLRATVCVLPFAIVTGYFFVLWLQIAG